MVDRLCAALAVDAHDKNGEGPCWDAVRQRCIWSDNEVGIIHEARSSAGGGWAESNRWNVGRPIGAAIPRRNGGFVVVGGTEILVMDETGGVRPFARLSTDADLVTLNDAKCDPQGRLWAGTYAKDLSRGCGALYRIDGDGSVTTVLKDVSFSNGLDWSPDGTSLYYIDSMARTVDAFDFDPVRGAISHRRTILTIRTGGFDGMTVDIEGCLWVAIYGLGEVRRYTPEGALLTRVTIPTPAVTSCAFGGANGEELFITSVAHIPAAVLPIIGLGMDVVKAADGAKQGGALFVCRPGPKGRPATLFAG